MTVVTSPRGPRQHSSSYCGVYGIDTRDGDDVCSMKSERYRSDFREYLNFGRLDSVQSYIFVTSGTEIIVFIPVPSGTIL